MEKVKVYYRLSDHGYQKVKPDYINNEKCLHNFISVFKNDDIEIIADNVSDKTYEWLSSLDLNVERTKLGSGAQSFNYVLDKAVKLEDNTIVYEYKTGPYEGQKLDKTFI